MSTENVDIQFPMKFGFASDASDISFFSILPTDVTFAKTRHPEPVEGSGAGRHVRRMTPTNRGGDVTVPLGRLDCGLRRNDETFAKESAE